MLPLNIFMFAATLIVGYSSGILVNYLSDVLPRTRSLSHPECAACAKPLTLADYFLMIRCAQCRSMRPARFWVVQIFYSAAPLVLWWFPQYTERLGFAFGMIVLIYFGIVTVIDLEHRLILHKVSLAGAVLCGAIGVWRHGWLATLAGGAVGFAVMWGLYMLGGVFGRAMSKRRGEPIDEVALGFGDVNLSGVMGLLLGFPGVGVGLLLTILLGGAGSLLVIIFLFARRRYQMLTAIPYGPFLVLSAALLLFRPL